MHTSDNVSVVMVCFGPDAPPRRFVPRCPRPSAQNLCQYTLVLLHHTACQERLKPAPHMDA